MQIIATFGLSLLTNIVVMMGATSFFYWMRSSTASRFVVTHRSTVTLINSVIFLTFLFCQAMANTYFADSTYGYHWTFLNLIIVTMFILNLQVGSKAQVAVDAGLIGAYYFLFTTHHDVGGVLAWLIAVACLAYTQVNVECLLSRRVLKYGVFALFAAAMLAMVWGMQPVALDRWFWVRQLTALAIIGGFCLEYDQAMRATARRTERIQTRANRDGLTGLLNFSEFNRALKLHYQAYQEAGGHAYSVFEFDLDWFKHVNDTYGHPAGNLVLRRLGHEIAAHAHSLAYPTAVYRLGGEEFAVIIEGSLTAAEAKRLAQNFQEQLRRVSFAEIDPQLRVTCSIGQARVADEDYSDNDVYKRADRNLYHAKQAGRNLVTVQAD